MLWPPLTKGKGRKEKNFIPFFLCLFLCFYALLYFLILPPCLPISFLLLKCHPQHSLSCFSQRLHYFVPVIRYPIHASQNPGHFLSKRFLTACILHFPPLYLWLYFLCLFLFHHETHFAYYLMVLLCNALTHHYLTIAHFLQVSPSAHHIIYLGYFFLPLSYINLCLSS